MFPNKQALVADKRINSTTVKSAPENVLIFNFLHFDVRVKIGLCSFKLIKFVYNDFVISSLGNRIYV